MLPYERFRQSVLLVLVAIGSSLLTHAYLQGNYLSFLTSAFLILLLIFALYRSRQEVILLAFLFSLAYFGYQWYFLPVLTKESFSLLAGNFLLFLIAGLAANFLFDWLKYALPRLEELSLTDKETGVWNVSQTKKLLQIAAEKRRRYGSTSSFLLLSFPDCHEEQSLNICYRLIKLFRHNIRLVDEIGRLSKNLFLIILPETPLNNAKQLKKRLEKMAEHFFAFEKEVAFRVEVFGTVDEVLEKALKKNE